MEIHLVRTSTGLRPYTDDDYEEMKKIKVGSIVKANIVRPRNIKFHRKFFALIRAAWDWRQRGVRKDEGSSSWTAGRWNEQARSSRVR